MKDLCMIVMFIINVILYISVIVWKNRYNDLYKKYEDNHNNYVTAMKMLQLFDKDLKQAIESGKVKVKGMTKSENN